MKEYMEKIDKGLDEDARASAEQKEREKEIISQKTDQVVLWSQTDIILVIINKKNYFKTLHHQSEDRSGATLVIIIV